MSDSVGKDRYDNVVVSVSMAHNYLSLIGFKNETPERLKFVDWRLKEPGIEIEDMFHRHNMKPGIYVVDLIYKWSVIDGEYDDDLKIVNIRPIKLRDIAKL